MFPERPPAPPFHPSDVPRGTRIFAPARSGGGGSSDSPECRMVRRRGDSLRRGGAAAPTDASKKQQLTGRIAPRSGTPYAGIPAKALIPDGHVRSPIGATRAVLSGGSATFPRACRRGTGSPQKRQLRRGFAHPRRLTWQGRLIDSKCRKRLKNRGVRRSLQCSSKWPVGSIPRVLGTANRKRGGLAEGAEGRFGARLWIRIPSPRQARTAVASCSVQLHWLPREEAQGAMFFLEP